MHAEKFLNITKSIFLVLGHILKDNEGILFLHVFKYNS